MVHPTRQHSAAAAGTRRACVILLLNLLSIRAPAADLPMVRHPVAGLTRDVEILIDRSGVPHIYAQSNYDAFFAQGFNAARDRLWQIDLWRKRGLGELAADFGPAYVEQDRAARLFLFRGDMHAEWIAYSSDAKRIVESFVAGVNAYVRVTREKPELLPPEFGLLNTKPALWSPADVVRIRSHGLAGNIVAEVARARTISTSGFEMEAFRRPLEPAWQTRVPEGLDPAAIPADVLRVYTLARATVEFTAEKLKGTPTPGRTGATAPFDSMPTIPTQKVGRDRQARHDPNASDTFGGPSGPALPHESNVPEPRMTESNNFVVAPGRSTTGRPIFANDPHRVQGVPSLRYFAHLSAPGLDVIGAGEPFLPGVSLGHNRTIAFGLTIFAIDQEDLYVYETNPAAPDEYRYRGHWEPMMIRTESIAVRGSEPRNATLKFTRHGPVIFEEPANHRAYAARVAWLQPGAVPYLSSLEYQRAQNWDEFLAAMNRHGCPPLNYLYADTAGNIGWAPSGLAPIRPNWDGLMPVPGDGRYEWADFRPMDELPRVFNPRAGWFGTSNEMNLPSTPGMAELKLSFEWADPARSKRQRQIFSGTRTFSVQDVIAAQTDITTVTGQRATALLNGIAPPTERDVARALQTLRAWDHRAARDSAGATIYNVWFHNHVRPAVVRRVAPAASVALIDSGNAAAIIDLLEKPDTRLGADPIRSRNEILLSALRDAVADLTKRLGADQSQWQWGRVHHALFEHPLASVASEAIRAQWNVGPESKAGDGETLGVSTWRPADFRLTAGASARFVTDVGDWKNAWATNTPGQSGDPRSPHYRDLFSDWAHDKYFPLLFDRAAVESAAEQRIVLVASP